MPIYWSLLVDITTSRLILPSTRVKWACDRVGSIRSHAREQMCGVGNGNMLLGLGRYIATTLRRKMALKRWSQKIWLCIHFLWPASMLKMVGYVEGSHNCYSLRPMPEATK